MKECVGIIAGSGQYPIITAQEAKKKGYKVIACGFKGYSESSLKDVVDVFQIFQLGQLNKMLNFFRKEGAIKICMAGSINKPRAWNFKPDLRALRLFFSLTNKGDDALLRAVIHEFEQEGFCIVSASSFVPSLHCPSGILSKKKPNDTLWKDILYGWTIIETIGTFDIGQLIVIKQGVVAAIECMEGTNATLQRGAELGGKGCVAVKRAKPNQDERADLPCVGLETIQKLISCNFTGLAVHAEKTLFFDLPEALSLADQHGLCIVSLTDEDIQKLSCH